MFSLRGRTDDILFGDGLFLHVAKLDDPFGVSCCVNEQTNSLLKRIRESIWNPAIAGLNAATSPDSDAWEQFDGWVRRLAWSLFETAFQLEAHPEEDTSNSSRTRATELPTTGIGTEVAPQWPDKSAPSEPDSGTFYFGRPHFQYRYAEDFPEDAQRQLESLRVKTTASLQHKPINSFADWMEVKTVWLLELVSGAARIIGRVAEMKGWGANQARDMLNDFTLKAAYAVGMTVPVVRRFFQSEKWKCLDDALFLVADTEGAYTQRIVEKTRSTLPKSAAQNNTQKRPGTRVPDIETSRAFESPSP